MKRWRLCAAGMAALVLSACGQPAPQETLEPDAGAAIEEEAASASPRQALPPVDAALLALPNTEFSAIEPSEVDIFGARTIDEALSPLLSPEALEEGASVTFSVREVEGVTIADIVRGDIPDDSVAAGHIRIEFRQEPEGWAPTNAYRRLMCRRGARANQWTTELCP